MFSQGSIVSLIDHVSIIWPVLWSLIFSQSDLFHRFYRFRLRDFFYSDVEPPYLTEAQVYQQEYMLHNLSKHDPPLGALFQLAYDRKSNPTGITFLFNTTLTADVNGSLCNVVLSNERSSHAYLSHEQEQSDIHSFALPWWLELVRNIMVFIGNAIWVGWRIIWRPVTRLVAYCCSTILCFDPPGGYQQILDSDLDLEPDDTMVISPSSYTPFADVSINYLGGPFVPVNPYSCMRLSKAMAISGAAFALSNGEYTFADSFSFKLILQLLQIGLGSWVYNQNWTWHFGWARSKCGHVLAKFMLLLFWLLPSLLLAYEVLASTWILCCWLSITIVLVILFCMSASLGWFKFNIILLSPLWRALLFFLPRGSVLELDPYVYLSDGGHNENLGVLALMYRKYQEIICFDAGADPQLLLADLYKVLQRAVRENVIMDDYEFLESPHKMTVGSDAEDCKGLSLSQIRVIVVNFRYMKEGGQAGSSGILRYVKATITGHESDTVLHIHTKQPDEQVFPHHPTINQRMNKDRRDAYIRLGKESFSGMMHHRQAEP